MRRGKAAKQQLFAAMLHHRRAHSTSGTARMHKEATAIMIRLEYTEAQRVELQRAYWN